MKPKKLRTMMTALLAVLISAVAAAQTATQKLVIEGTGGTAQFKVSAVGLITDITVSATHGFSVSPTTIAAGEEATVTVTNLTTLAHSTGKVILRSADMRSYVQLSATGTPLARKDLSQNPVYPGGDDDEMSFTDFSPGKDGYTIEFKARIDNANKEFTPYAVSADGVGFKSYATSSGLGLYNSSSKKGLSNPSNGGTFYNTDGLYHTYRYAVTSDKRVIVYRDGITVDTLRTQDLALPADFAAENGDVVSNMLKNPGFEGEWNTGSGVVNRIEGWDVSPIDQYNSTQEIIAQERSNDVDQDNHVLSISRYKWNAGWSAAQISQIVDVAPNEVYSFSALAKGGIKSDGTQLGSIRIYDMQNSDNKVTIPVTSDSYQTYGTDFETQASTRQIKVEFYLERDSWGASISALQADDVKLTGVSREVEAKAGFENSFADLAYFTYDATGAYAPTEAGITVTDIATAIELVPNEESVDNFTWQFDNGRLRIDCDGAVAIYLLNGTMANRLPKYTRGETIELPNRGIYIIVVQNGEQRKSFKLKY